MATSGVSGALSFPMIRPVKPITSVAVTNVAYSVPASESGTIYFVNTFSTAAMAITLPAPAPGLYYRFTHGVAGHDWTLATLAAANIMTGSITVANTVITCTLRNTLTVATANADLGTYIDVVCDGVKWGVQAATGVAAGIATN